MNILLIVGVLFVVVQCVKILICNKKITLTFFVYSSVFQTVQLCNHHQKATGQSQGH